MAANLSPEYKDAQEAYRRARDPKERLEHLREMLRTIPKHKGTEHMQADLKGRIKELTEELAAPRKAGPKGPVIAVPVDGAAQAVLLGPPNSGKSSLHVRLTGSHAVVGPYPFATKVPLPGMLAHEDIHFQLVDLPPVSADYVEPWMGNAVEHADAALLVVDLSDPDCVDALGALQQQLARKRVSLVPPEAPPPADDDDVVLPIRLPTALLANKSDLLAEAAAELATFVELTAVPFPALAVSAETGAGLDRIGPLLFRMAHVVRVYGKLPGHPADRAKPFTVREGGTVRDVARQIHRGLAETLKFARVWGSGKFDGEQVSPGHVVKDGDVLELHG